jgi:hypothetical protein
MNLDELASAWETMAPEEECNGTADEIERERNGPESGTASVMAAHDLEPDARAKNVLWTENAPVGKF